MPNEVLFVGGRRETISILSGNVTQTTDTARFDTVYSDCALLMGNSNARFKADFYTETSNVLSKVIINTPGTRIFVHFVLSYGASAFQPAGPIFRLVDTDGFEWFSIRGSGSGISSTTSFGIFWNSGTGAVPVWTEIGTSSPITTSLEAWDVEFTLGTPHSVNVYRNGSIWKSGIFTQAAFTNIDHVAFSSPSTVGGQPNTAFSQIMVTDNVSTVGSFVRTARATGIGANVGFTGNHTSVNEVVVNDLTIQSATVAGLRTTHAMSNVTVPSGLEIRAVFHWLRAKNDGVAPNNLRSVLRSGGIDYVTPNMPLLNIGYSPVGARYNVDPLGTNWTETEWNNIEAGYESAT